MTAAQQPTFDAEAYWSRYEYKKWVVHLLSIRKGQRREEVRYVRAKTEEGAIRTAKAFTHLTGRIGARARLATPRDLGCVEITANASL